MMTVSLRFKLGAHAAIVALLSGTMLTPPALAQDTLPTGGQVVSGSATIATSGPSMTVNQSSDRMIANWQSFSIGASNSVTFNQPNTQSVALNRVIGQDPSQILGSLSANGQVFLVNPNGIVIGKGGRVETGGFVGSTLGLADRDFLNGNYRFTGTGGTILNQGDLKGGIVALLAPRVSNDGTITGTTALAAGTDVTLDFDGDGLIAVEVGASSLATLVENKGLIKADGGLAILTAKGANDALRGVVNNSGVIEAQSLTARDGRILLLGDMNNGEVNAAGTLTASFVETSAARVNIADDLTVKTNGGTWLIDPNDFTIAASGGNITGAALSSNLASGNVSIATATQGTAGGNGDIFVNDTVSWSASTLTLTADRNIDVNRVMTASGSARLALNYGANGTLNMAMRTNESFRGQVNLSGSSQLTINGQSYTIIRSATELQAMRNDLSGYYALGSDIDASSISNFRPVDDLSHSFEGLGHVIDGLKISRTSSDDVGLFARAESGASIANVGLTNARVSGNNNVGILVGYNDGAPIRNSFASGTVTGQIGIGGLLGVSNSATVTNVYTNGNVSGNWLVGGLIGKKNAGAVSDSFSNADVSGGNDVGGLVGHNNGGNLIRVNATGAVDGTAELGGLVGWNDAGGWIYQSSASGNVTGQQTVGGLVGRNGTINNMAGTIEQSSASGDVAGYNKVGALVGFDYGRIISSSGTGRVTILTPPTPPAPPPPPPLTLTGGISSSYSTSSVPFQQTFNLSGTGFSGFGPNPLGLPSGQITLTWTDPTGRSGTVIWNASNNFGGGKFVVNSDTSASISPVLLARGDPPGTYKWTVTFSNALQTVTRSFTVNYGAAQLQAPVVYGPVQPALPTIKPVPPLIQNPSVPPTSIPNLSSNSNSALSLATGFNNSWIAPVLQGTSNQVGVYQKVIPTLDNISHVTWGYNSQTNRVENGFGQTNYAPIDTMDILVSTSSGTISKTIYAFGNIDSAGNKNALNGPFQCTALIATYLDALGFTTAPTQLPNGNNVAQSLGTGANAQFFEYSPTGLFPPKVGSILSISNVSTTGNTTSLPYGHVAIIKGISVISSTQIVATLIEQNMTLKNQNSFAVDRQVTFNLVNGKWQGFDTIGPQSYPVTWATPIVSP